MFKLLAKKLINYLENQGELDEFLKNPEKTKELMLYMLKYGYESIMNNEMGAVLGFKKHDRNEEKNNYRNGKRYRDLDTGFGKIVNLEVPRARYGFYPGILEKYQRRLEQIDDIVISLYAKGLSTQDISEQIELIYGQKYSKETISNITDKVIKDLEAFKSRVLEESYYVIYIDAMFVNIRREDSVCKEAIYFLLGINTEGKRDVLGFYINPTESSSFYNDIFEDIKQRGVKKVLLFVTDGLRGIEEVISNHYPESKIQRCIYHVSNNISTHVRVKDREEILSDFKEVYTQKTKQEALKKFMGNVNFFIGR